ncbi:PTS sugar transporter subunit IIB [Isoptericola sp. b490]|uniref:PTS sugar transporter subunit IIB n=1 Tax=Actinotalea lenta TaxID=3064654 RepID=UPI00271440BD|nr:PTS sugar transporter subunit IIB [Isoptericola sp. b490]MDO8120632.1 PTS sugar transporter subunit IIB [Isoptericola sp. b490]
MKIITVCGMGIGTSILLKMNADRALERLGLTGDVEAVDLGAARGAAAGADLILTSAEVADALVDVPAQVRVVHDFMDIDEICRAITQAPDLRTAGG